MGENKKITHVIFDMDGLLLDTERIYTECYSRVVARYGKEYTWEVKVKCMGRKNTEAARIIIEDLGLPLTPEQWIQEANEETAKHFPDTILLPGAEKLVRHLHQHSVPICVASGSASDSFEKKTVNHKEFFSLFHHIVCSGSDKEVKHGKPHPDIFQIAAARFEGPTPQPQNVLVFEDALNGVESARAADMYVVAVPDERSVHLVVDRAHLILSTLEEFQLEDWGLPPYDN